MENQSGLRQNWREKKEKLKKKFAKLTDKDFSFPEDKQSEIIKRLQLKLGKTEEEIYKIITNL